MPGLNVGTIAVAQVQAFHNACMHQRIDPSAAVRRRGASNSGLGRSNKCIRRSELGHFLSGWQTLWGFPVFLPAVLCHQLVTQGEQGSSWVSDRSCERRQYMPGDHDVKLFPLPPTVHAEYYVRMQSNLGRQKWVWTRIERSDSLLFVYYPDIAFEDDSSVGRYDTSSILNMLSLSFFALYRLLGMVKFLSAVWNGRWLSMASAFLSHSRLVLITRSII